MPHVRIATSSNHANERKALAFMVVAIIGVFGVWAFQVRAMLAQQKESFANDAQNSPIADVLDYSATLEQQVPVTQQDIGATFHELEEAFTTPEPKPEPALDEIAQKMLDGLNAPADESTEILPSESTADPLPLEQTTSP